jgi:hypothetical protein
MYSKVASFNFQILACYFVLKLCHDLAFLRDLVRLSVVPMVDFEVDFIVVINMVWQQWAVTEWPSDQVAAMHKCRARVVT